jgi:hypothetical protein
VSGNPVWFDLTPYEAVAKIQPDNDSDHPEWDMPETVIGRLNPAVFAFAKGWLHAIEGYTDGYYRIHAGYGKNKHIIIEGLDAKKMEACWKALLHAVADAVPA